MTVNGAGGLSTTGEINIEGSATVQSTLNVANAAAGFGTAGVETGTVFLQNDALLGIQERRDHHGQWRALARRREFAGRRRRDARQQQRADRLATVAGNFCLENGATVAPTGNVSVTGNGTMRARREQQRRRGRLNLTIGGNLSNTSGNGDGGVSVGNTGITSADTLTVNGTGGLSNASVNIIDIEGSATVQATLNVANAAAGFGTAGTETGVVFLQNDALLEFKSGQITTVDGLLQLDGANCASPTPASCQQQRADRALHRVRQFLAAERREGPTTGNLSVTDPPLEGTVQVDGNNVGGGGGSSLTIGGSVSNSSDSNNGVSVGYTSITSADTLTVNGTGGLSNASSGEINIEGSATVQATLNVANAAAGFGTAGWNRDGLPPKRRAPGIQERPDHNGRWPAAAQRRECAHRRRGRAHHQ